MSQFWEMILQAGSKLIVCLSVIPQQFWPVPQSPLVFQGTETRPILFNNFIHKLVSVFYSANPAYLVADQPVSINNASDNWISELSNQRNRTINIFVYQKAVHQFLNHKITFANSQPKNANSKTGFKNSV